MATSSAATAPTTTAPSVKPSAHMGAASDGLPPGPPGAQELVLLVQVVDEPLDRAGRRDVAPAAGDVVLVVPARLHVLEVLRDAPQRPDERAEQPGGVGRNGRAGRRHVERREAVGEARHRAADTDAAGVHAAAHVVDGPAGGDVALDDRPPAADLYQALLVAELLRE